jgi:hypothetical protein
MVKERGVADREAGISMRSWGWVAYKKRDAVVCPQCKYVIWPAGYRGTFDFPVVGVPRLGRIVFIHVEVKAGDTNFPFIEFSEEQREWALNHPDEQKFIWLCLGRSLRDEKKPRKTYLFPLELFYDIERKLLPSRKSIPYGYEPLSPYELTWRGHGMWELYDGFLNE